MIFVMIFSKTADFLSRPQLVKHIESCFAVTPMLLRSSALFAVLPLTQARRHVTPVGSTCAQCVRQGLDMDWWKQVSSLDISGLWCQKQVSQAGINNCIPQYSVGCNHYAITYPCLRYLFLVPKSTYMYIGEIQLRFFVNSDSVKYCFVIINQKSIQCEFCSDQERWTHGFYRSLELCHGNKLRVSSLKAIIG